MGRLSALSRGARLPAAAPAIALALAMATLAGCDAKEGAAHQEGSRVAAVTASPAPASPAPTAPTPTAAAAGSASKGSTGGAGKLPRQLCVGQLRSTGKKLAGSKLDTAVSAGAAPPRMLAASDGQWTWVNLWAAWCVPCKEEIPRLLAWDARLRAEEPGMVVRFVSLDDDARQLQAFLDAQPANGLKATHWLREGKDREAWLTSAGVDPDPDLPAHVLLGPDGKVQCVIQGAIEDSDLPSALAIASGGAG